MGKNCITYDSGSGIAQARAYREMACLYYQEISKDDVGANDSRFCSGIWSVCVSWAFSCEISLKLLNEAEKGRVATGHGLKDLFDSLSCETQDKLISLTRKYYAHRGWGLLDKDEFEGLLAKSNHTFTNERYLFELKPGTSHSASPTFLEAFSYALLERLSELNLSPRVF